MKPCKRVPGLTTIVVLIRLMSVKVGQMKPPAAYTSTIYSFRCRLYWVMPNVVLVRCSHQCSFVHLTAMQYSDIHQLFL
jgi:hypothetical protein